ncbi:MAG TPA: GGDEF domain-containing protein [Longimicrobiales bacterium]
MERKPYPGAPVARHLKVESSTEALPEEFGERHLRALTRRIEDLSSAQQYVAVALLLAAITVVDAVSGEISFSIFYLLPVSMLAWYRGWYHARVAVLVATLMWLLADVVANPQHSGSFIQYWNAVVSFGVFAIVGYTLSRLRIAVDEEQRLARTDILTGAANNRSFTEFIAREVARQQRYNHPLSMAFLDCDDFKLVNDRFGHAKGDELLRTIAANIQSELRTVDMVARLGGDEFAVVLPESNAYAADTVSHKVRSALLAATTEYNVTFSIGVVTYLEPAGSTDELLHTADQVMYEAKRAGKNMIRHRVIGSPAAEGVNA